MHTSVPDLKMKWQLLALSQPSSLVFFFVGRTVKEQARNWKEVNMKMILISVILTCRDFVATTTRLSSWKQRINCYDKILLI